MLETKLVFSRIPTLVRIC